MRIRPKELAECSVGADSPGRARGLKTEPQSAVPVFCCSPPLNNHLQESITMSKKINHTKNHEVLCGLDLEKKRTWDTVLG